MSLPKIPSPDVGKLAKELRSGHRAALARAITLIESRRGDHQAAARDLVQALLSDTGKAIRVGITGSPGVGKSTTIDVLGMYLIGRGHKVAVLAVGVSFGQNKGPAKAQKSNYGTAAFSISNALREEAVKCAGDLAEAGHTLTDATRFFLAHLQAQQNSISVAEARIRAMEAQIRALQRKVFPGDSKFFGPEIVAPGTAAIGLETIGIEPGGPLVVGYGTVTGLFVHRK